MTTILATLPSPTAPKNFASRQVGSLLGLPLIMSLRGVKAVNAKRAALEGIHHKLPKKSVYFCRLSMKTVEEDQPQVRDKNPMSTLEDKLIMFIFFLADSK